MVVVTYSMTWYIADAHSLFSVPSDFHPFTSSIVELSKKKKEFDTSDDVDAGVERLGQCESSSTMRSALF